MVTNRRDVLARILADTTHRATMGLGLAALMSRREFPLAAAKRRKRHKRKNKKTKPKPEPICAESCPAPCGTCFHRLVGPPLCGNVGAAVCNRPCLSDNDCIGTDTPYCYTGATSRISNEFDPITCTNGNRSICVAITPCS